MNEIPDISLDIPEYCNFYKHLLVEDIIFSYHPALLHYGKCAVIGFLLQEESSLIKLNSVEIPTLPDDCQLPDGHARIPLYLNDYLETNRVPLNSYVEVFGETILYDKSLEINDYTICSTKELITKLRSKQLNMEKSLDLSLRRPTTISDQNLNEQVRLHLKNMLAEMQDQYVSGIKVHTINVIDHPKELIICNLQLKLLRTKLKSKASSTSS